MRRFERICDVVEPIEEYRHGGYHPVHLYDLFHQRYKVIGKLAFGQFSTVWLALDLQLQRHVALKIVKADFSYENKELDVLLYLSKSRLDHPGKKNVVELLDHFEHQGPNGKHLCLVLPVMLSDGEAMTITSQPRDANFVLSISKQIILGLDFLHKSGLIHCDLQPANIMFSVARAPSTRISLQTPEFSPVKWLQEAAVDNSAPQYLMPSQRLRGTLDNTDVSALVVKIGDLGGATWNNGRHYEQPVTPRSLRPPELISRDTWDSSIDIWCLGCLIFQLATNEPLFPLSTFGLTADQINEEQESLIRKIIDSDCHDHKIFASYLRERLPTGFGTENVQHFASFLRSMLQRDPPKRKSAAQLLSDPWIRRK